MKPARSKLGIGHLMLWTVCCSIYLAILRAMGSLPPTLLGVSVVVFAAAVDGLALMGVVLFFARWFRRERSSLEAAEIEPGEWLLAILGTRLIVHLLLKTWLQPTFQNPDAVLHGFSCALFVLPTLQRKLPTFWKLMFGLISVLYLAPLVFGVVWPTVFGSVPWGSDLFLGNGVLPRGLLTAALVVGFSIQDFRQRGERRWSWLHWTGIAVCVIAAFSSLILGRFA